MQGGHMTHNVHPTHHSGDEAEVTRHDVIKIVCDKNSPYVQLDLVRVLGVILEHVSW